MNEIILGLIVFAILWIPTFYLHEVMHWVEAARQGVSAYIRVWMYNGLPSIICTPNEELKNKHLFNFAGGLYSGFLLLLASLSFHAFGIHWVGAPLMMYSMLNLFYGVYEMSLINELPIKEYMRGRWLTYGLGLLYGFGLYLWAI